MIVKEELLAEALRAFQLDQATLRVIVVMPVCAIGQLGSNTLPTLVVLGTRGFTEGIGDTGEKTVAVVVVRCALPGAVDLGGDLAQGVPFTLVGRAHCIGDRGRAVGQAFIVIGEGSGAFRPGDLQRLAAFVACNLPALVLGSFDTHGVA